MLFKLGDLYTRASIGEVLQDGRLKSSREGILSSGNSILLFVTLDKAKQLNAKLQYNDFFEGNLFHWDSQTTQTINTPRIQKIVKGEVDVLLLLEFMKRLNLNQTHSYIVERYPINRMMRQHQSRFILFLIA